jgi:Cu/Ag efflux protein CusF
MEHKNLAEDSIFTSRNEPRDYLCVETAIGTTVASSSDYAGTQRMTFHFTSRSLVFILGLPLLLCIYGCPSSDLATSGEGRGKLLRMDTVHKQVTLDHDHVPAMMQSLIMAYPVTSTALFNGLKVGDSVSFTLTATRSTNFLVTRLTKIPPRK